MFLKYLKIHAKCFYNGFLFLPPKIQNTLHFKTIRALNKSLLNTNQQKENNLNKFVNFWVYIHKQNFVLKIYVSIIGLKKTEQSVCN